MTKFEEAVAAVAKTANLDVSCSGCGNMVPKYFDQFPNFCPSCGRRSSHETFVNGQVARIAGCGYDPQTCDLGDEVKAIVSKCGCGFKLPEGEQAAFCPGCGLAIRGAGTMHPNPGIEKNKQYFKKINHSGEEDETLGL